jgi:phosphopentomutase
MLQGKHGVGRVIARPFGESYPFKRLSGRHDYSLLPPKETMLDRLKARGYDVISVGKINDIFAAAGITESHPTVSNSDGMDKALAFADKDFCGLCFVNLVDFDMVFGHRNNIDGYAQALTDFDVRLGELLEKLGEDDLLIITADHGCDPATPSTDHSREYVPVLIYRKGEENVEDLGTKQGFFFVANTVENYLK